MCEKCVEIDRRIARLKDMASRILDQQMLDGIDRLVSELEAKKLSCTPSEKTERPFSSRRVCTHLDPLPLSAGESPAIFSDEGIDAILIRGGLAVLGDRAGCPRGLRDRRSWGTPSRLGTTPRPGPCSCSKDGRHVACIRLGGARHRPGAFPPARARRAFCGACRDLGLAKFVH